MYILGVRVDNISMNEALERVKEFLTDNSQHYIVTPNPEIVVIAEKDENLKNILNKADLAIPDGFGLILASKFLGQPLKERIQGVDLMRKICIDERFEGHKIFLLGGFSGVARKTIGQLQDEEERYQYEESLEQAVKSINKFQPDILFVGLGAPKQEKWIAENLEKIPSVKLAMAVGGAFNFLSGRVKRAPIFMQKLKLEWLWRLILQPWRISRIYNAVIIFPWLVLKNKINDKC